MHRTLLLAPLAALLATSAFAIDVTTCRTIVPDHEEGLLQADLTCPGTAVTLGRSSTLELNGHTISAPVGVDVNGARSSQRATIRGPGEINGTPCTWGVHVWGGRLNISDVTIHGCTAGNAQADQGVGIYAPRGRVLATNVATNGNHSGMILRHLVATDVSANDNDHYGITTNGGHGENLTFMRNGLAALVYGTFGRYTNLVAMNNGSPNYYTSALSGAKIVLIDSTVVDNDDQDISGFRRPKLIGTTCGTSNWGVCSND